MEPKQNQYPVFEINQVLSNSHLNQVFDYLDEQERLTRANLIGIGIACGLEINLITSGTAKTIHLAKGCGVTSEGYLIIEPEEVSLVSYRNYKLPDDLDYPPLRNNALPERLQYPLWELFPAGEPETTPLENPANFLDDKAVLLFYELKKEALRTCSPNDCNDKGAEVTVTIRRLLIQQADLNKVIAAANDLPGNSSTADLEKVLLAKLNLPDLRLPRYDVPNTAPITSNEVLAAFLVVFSLNKLVQTTGAAFSAAYQAFKPLLQKRYPSDPFTNFTQKFGFLDSAPKNTTQVRFLAYYYDFFDDLCKAYGEFCRHGVKLLCACVPQDGLFPRHLGLGLLFPDAQAKPGIYRQQFLASPAVAKEACTKELEQLFQRLVEMTVRFTNAPPLPKQAEASKTDEQIRLTPSILNDVPLASKAIPYYYLQNGMPPLYQLWNYDKSRQLRANQNLSYRSDEFTPAAPVFVTQPLNYDLEPYNFLRIEGHLGKDYISVLNTLLYYKNNYRLPIEVIALRTGAFDETPSVDLSKEACLFQDLEILYDTLREKLLSSLCEGLMYLYDIPIAGSELPGGMPQHPLLKKYAPNFRHKAGTVGAWYEKYLTAFQTRPYIDVDQDKIDANAVLMVYCQLFAGTTGLPEANFANVVSIYYLTKLSEVLPESLDSLAYADFENKYEDLLGLIRFFRSDAISKISDQLKVFIPQEELIDHFDQILFSCELEPIKAVHEDFDRRLNEIKQRQFLSYFQQQHPGLQHKAGVPLGGTFIVVYHSTPKPKSPPPGLRPVPGRLPVATAIGRITPSAMEAAFKRLIANPELKEDPDVRILMNTITDKIPEFSGIQVPPRGTPVPLPSTPATEIIDKAVAGLNEGTVITDFFLPYLCCSECPPIQYTLPVPPLGLTVKLACTDPGKGTAAATMTPLSGIQPFFYQIDQQPFKVLAGAIELTPGSHTLKLRDSAGTESELQSLIVPEPLTIGEETYSDNLEAKTYTVTFNISGGTAPYTFNPANTASGLTYTSPAAASGASITIEIIDSAGCKISKSFEHIVAPPCILPCDGLSRRCAYRLWLQPPIAGTETLYKDYKQEGAINLQFNGENIALPNSDALLQLTVNQLNGDFNKAVGGAVKSLNAAINQALIAKFGEDLGRNRLVLTYEPAESDPFAVLRIEYFVCETFTLSFNFSYALPSIAYSLTVRYTQEKFDPTHAVFNGAIIINRRMNNKVTQVPPFDCQERDQCHTTAYENLCKIPPFKTEVKIERLEGNNQFQFTGGVKDITPSDIVAWVWDALTAQPTEPFYEGQTVKTQLQKPGGPVRLTTISKDGCTSIGQSNIPT